MKKSLFVLILIGGWVIPSWAQNNKEFEQLCKNIRIRKMSDRSEWMAWVVFWLPGLSGKKRTI